ncbi:hypothetical protein RN001_004004 [Aquatica leii]|uniref:Major facilitator superfamily (MFS) profile domain-containing protein n=1 Tax=Aquatica leii TaxID=1421715 RepID=A0AAN7QPE4_9COLE|nr:hypothetical protein RN001_004004 [Aquatica leii]
MEKKKKRVPPDGGYGWVVVFAFASFNFLVIPMFQNYGLIFRSTFRDIGLSATNESFIVTSGLAIGMLAGIGYGPILKRFGYRKVCVVSAFLTSFGTIMMVFANSMLGFIVTYGLFTSLGIAMGMTGYSIALNTYFVKRKSFATGFAFTITCLGSIVMPQVISFLLFEYGVRGTVLLIGGLTLNTFASALLLHPIKWHMIEVDDNEENADNSIYTIKMEENKLKQSSLNASNTTISSDPNLIIVEEEKKDKHFVNLLMGIALATFAEQSFSSLTPFILSDLEFTIPEIATFLSCLSVTDLIFRFITPFVGNYFKVTARQMCMISFLLLTCSRFTLFARPETFAWIVVIAFGIGVGKGVRTVYWTLVLPEYLPLKLLPSASGLHMVINGAVLFIGGPLLGVARDITGNYVNCIYITNAITILALMLWTTEILCNKCKSSKTLEITKL